MGGSPFLLSHLLGRVHRLRASAGSRAGHAAGELGSVPAQDQEGKHDDHDDYDCSEADKHGSAPLVSGGKRGMPDPAEPGGRGWMAEPGAGLLTRTGIRRVSYFSKACLMLPLAWSPRPSAWSASLPATFTGGPARE
jgi:hypothetical protein